MPVILAGVEYKLRITLREFSSEGAMQTVRRYAYLLGIGLVAALVLSPTSRNFIFQSAGDIAAGGAVSSQGNVLLMLLGGLIIAALIKQTLSGIPDMFRSRIQRFKRRAMILIIVVMIVGTCLFV